MSETVIIQITDRQSGEWRGSQFVYIPRFITETWKRTDQYCPGCGKQPVYVEDGNGDYYVGPTFLCASCGEEFTFQGGCLPTTDMQRERLQRLQEVSP